MGESKLTPQIHGTALQGDGTSEVQRIHASWVSGDHPRPRIFFDLSTSLAWKGRHAVGIVRTERELAARLLEDRDFDVVPVVYHEGFFRAIDPEAARDLISVRTAPVSRGTAPHPLADNPDATKLGDGGLTKGQRIALSKKLALSLTRVLRLLARRAIKQVPERAREDVRHSLIYARSAFRRLVYTQNIANTSPHLLAAMQEDHSLSEVAEPEPLDLSLIVHPEASDILFICGLGWDVLDWRTLSISKVRHRFKIAAVVYDLIPEKFPEFLGAPADFWNNYFLHMADNCEILFCISKSTERDLLAYLKQTGRQPVRTEVFLLGANLTAEPSATEITDEQLKRRLESRRYALAVGTFEIRKNYKLLIDLWEDLVNDNRFDLDLVIVGMPGWCVDDLISRLRGMPIFGNRIHWFHRLSDSGLSWLYENCHLSLFPSLYEGWGLPVVEALQHHRPVIASSRGATPEAGLGMATILDPEDYPAWKTALIESALSERQVLNIPPGLLPTWDDAATSVKSGLNSLLEVDTVE